VSPREKVTESTSKKTKRTKGTRAPTGGEGGKGWTYPGRRKGKRVRGQAGHHTDNENLHSRGSAGGEKQAKRKGTIEESLKKNLGGSEDLTAVMRKRRRRAPRKGACPLPGKDHISQRVLR